MKKLVTLSALAALTFSVSQAAPLVTIGDQLDIFFRGEVAGRWDSNITSTQSPLKKDDYSINIKLGAELDYGRNSKFKFNVKFFENFHRYLNYSQFNSNLASVFVNTSYEETILRVDANFSYIQLKQNSSDIISSAELVRRDHYNAGVKGVYDFSDKIFTEIGFNWFWEKFIGKWSDLYSDQDIYSVPVSVYYNITPKIAAGLTYQYRYSEYSGGPNSWVYGINQAARTDHFGGLTIRGEILPKLSATAYVGVSYRDVEDVNDDTTFNFSATLGYELTEKLHFFGRGFRDNGNGASRQSMIVTGGEVGARYAFSHHINSVASFMYRNTEYQWVSTDRDDDEYIARVGVEYKPNKFITIGANYRYMNNASNLAAACYNSHLIDLTFGVRY